MRAPRTIIVLTFVILAPALSEAKGYSRWAHRLCDEPGFHCVTIDKYITVEEQKEVGGELTAVEKNVRPTWDNMWPDPRERLIVRKLNRMNIRLRKGMKIAVPDDMDGKTFMDFSPFPRYMDYGGREKFEPLRNKLDRLISAGLDFDLELDYMCNPEIEPETWPLADARCEAIEDMAERRELIEGKKPKTRKLMVYDPKLLAWAAYENDALVNWGPGAGGKSYCSDVGRSCRTKTGVTRIYNKRGRWARSSKYPIDCEGRSCAAVPYYMGFFRAYGFHASWNVPGRHASHGCIRLFFDDAKWLHEEFAEIGTKAIIRRY